MIPDQELEPLVDRARRGGAAEFRELVRATEGLVSRVVGRMVDDAEEAEEVVQDVFVDAYRILPNWQPGARFTTWLYRTAMNAALARRRAIFRRRARVTTPGDEALAAHAASSAVRTDPAAAMAQAELVARVNRAIAELPDRQRAVFILRHHEELPLAEIAEILGLALGTVKSHLSAAIETLRTRLAAANATDPKQRARR